MVKRISSLVGVGLALFGGSCFGSIIYYDSLPNINLNDAAGNLRSNIAFGESDPTASFDGTDVTFSEAVTINDISSWSVASTYGEALGQEFSSVTLYYRALGGTWQVLETGSPDTSFDVPLHPNEVGDSNPNMLSTQVSYNGPVTQKNSYEGDGTPGVYYPLWQNDFLNLDLILGPGTYEFAVNGVGANPDPNTLYGYWFNSFVNGPLSGSQQTNNSGTYIRCSYSDLSGPCFTEDPTADGTWNKGADLNFEVTGIIMPEPSSWVMFGTGLLSMGFFSVRRKNRR